MLTVSKTVPLISQENLLSSDLRHIIIDKIIEGRGDPLTMIFPGRFVDIANELNVPLATVSKIYHVGDGAPRSQCVLRTCCIPGL